MVVSEVVQCICICMQIVMLQIVGIWFVFVCIQYVEEVCDIVGLNYDVFGRVGLFGCVGYLQYYWQGEEQ